MLEFLCFDLQLESTYRILWDYSLFLGVGDNRPLRHSAYAFLNDSTYTVLCLQFQPRVIAAAGLDPDEWQGFAFGTGIDRLAMLKYGMDDLRAFFDADLRWLKHYGFRALDVPTLSGGVGA